jgi:hypothetical protein
MPHGTPSLARTANVIRDVSMWLAALLFETYFFGSPRVAAAPVCLLAAQKQRGDNDLDLTTRVECSTRNAHKQHASSNCNTALQARSSAS